MAGGPSKFAKMNKQFAQEQVMQQAIQDYAAEMKQEEDWKMEILREKELAAQEKAEEEDWDFSDDDEISNKIMEQRMAEMRGQANEAMDWRAKGHGEMNEIREDEFLKTVTKSKFAVVHFYHPDMPRCKIVDMHLEKLAPKYIATKFARIDAVKAPFFVEKLDIMIMPAVCMFEDGKMMGRLDGLDMLGGTEDFSTEIMECVIGASGCIAYTPPDDVGHIHSIFQQQRADIVGLNKESKAETDTDDDE